MSGHRNPRPSGRGGRQPKWNHPVTPLAVAHLAARGTEPPAGRPQKACKRTRCVEPDHWAWPESTSAPASDPLAALGAAIGIAGQGWQERALCAQTDPEAFFPEKGGSTREAKRVCAACEVRPQCLEYALANDERFGIWGGMSERERRKQRRMAA